MEAFQKKMSGWFGRKGDALAADERR
jgi:hypothetical protein